MYESSGGRRIPPPDRCRSAYRGPNSAEGRAAGVRPVFGPEPLTDRSRAARSCRSSRVVARGGGVRELSGWRRGRRSGRSRAVLPVPSSTAAFPHRTRRRGTTAPPAIRNRGSPVTAAPRRAAARSSAAGARLLIRFVELTMRTKRVLQSSVRKFRRGRDDTSSEERRPFDVSIDSGGLRNVS